MDELDIAIKAVRAYAEMHPRPTQVNQTQAAQMLGISHPIVRKFVLCQCFVEGYFHHRHASQ